GCGAARSALAAGNTVALKHASNVSGCALAMEGLWKAAGLPAHAFTVLLVPGSETSELVAHPAVAAATLTGSEPAGASLAAAAGRALQNIVLGAAAVAFAAQQAAAARTINNGQSCIAAKRFIVVEEVADAFEAAFGRALAALRVGDPMDRATDVGPLARADLVSELERQLA